MKIDMEIDMNKVRRRLAFMERSALRIDYRKVDHKCRLCGEPATSRRLP